MPRELPLPDPPLADGRVALRPWGPDDLVDLLAAAADPLVHRYRYSLPDGAGQAVTWLDAVGRDRLDGVRLELAVTVAGDPTVVGSVALWGFHRRNHTAMVSYWLGPAARGRGLGTSALHLVSGWAFGLGLRRLSLNVEVDNLASQRLAERCGFRREGRLRSHQKLRDGTRADVFVYGLLAGEPMAVRR